MNKTLYTIIQWTWGLPQTLVGSAVYLVNKDKESFDFNGAKVTVWGRDDGVSLGKFIFIPKVRGPVNNNEFAQNVKYDKGCEDIEKRKRVIVSKTLILHEYGHSLQSLILGPTYLLVVGVPSLLWARLPYFVNKREKTGRSYYSPLFERTADKLGKNDRA